MWIVCDQGELFIIIVSIDRESSRDEVIDANILKLHTSLPWSVHGGPTLMERKKVVINLHLQGKEVYWVTLREENFQVKTFRPSVELHGTDRCLRV